MRVEEGRPRLSLKLSLAAIEPLGSMLSELHPVDGNRSMEKWSTEHKCLFIQASTDMSAWGTLFPGNVSMRSSSSEKLRIGFTRQRPEVGEMHMEVGTNAFQLQLTEDLTLQSDQNLEE